MNADPGLTAPVAVALGLAVGVVPLLIAYWPRIVALIAEGKRGPCRLSPEMTPFVAGLLSGLTTVELLACGFLWVIARKPQERAGGGEKQAAASGAETYLRESLCPPGAVDDAGEVAHTILEGTSPAAFEVSAVMAGLRECSQDDARRLGLLRSSGWIGRLLLVLAACELAVALYLESVSAAEVLLIGATITTWAALHVDPRSLAGANLTGDLRRLRAHLREAALAAESMASPALRELVPVAANAAETEVWAVAAGCQTAGSVRAASRLQSMAHAAERPRTIRYTQMVMLTGGRMIDSLMSPVQSLLHRDRPPPSGPDGATPVLW